MTTISDDGPPLALLPEQQFTLEETARLLKVAKITVKNKRRAATADLARALLRRAE